MACVEIVEKVLRQCGGGGVTDEALAVLQFFFPRELDDALELVDRGMVTVYCGVPSGREFIWLNSPTAPKQRECYCIARRRFCSCRYFDFAVRERRDSLLVSSFQVLLLTRSLVLTHSHTHHPSSSVQALAGSDDL
jgi:hypothetical protein